MRILKLEAENVKRLRAVAIKPDGAVIKIAGKNKQGKTSLLDAIQALFGGKDAQQPQMIRRGEKAARVVAELDSLTVERSWTSKGTYLKVRAKDGAIYSSPQAILDKLTNELAFDPVAFLREKPARQMELVRQLVGVDTSEIDALRAAAYEQRTDVNRQASSMKARLDGLPVVDAPDEEISITDLLAERERLDAQRRKNEEARSGVGRAEAALLVAQRAVAEQEGEIARLEKALAAARSELNRRTEGRDTIEDTLAERRAAAAELVDPDMSGVNERLRTVEDTNRKVRTKKQRAQVAGEHQALVTRAAELTARIEDLDAQRQRMISEAPFPVPGLGFSDGGLTYQGLPFEQASAAEQLIVSLAMAKAKNPKLRVFLIRDASLLDPESMAELERFCEQNDMQAWLEIVGRPEDAAVIIEDGMASGPSAVAAEDAAPPAQLDA